MMKEIIKYLQKLRQKSNRIRTMYLYMRSLKKFEGWSDIILLNSIVAGLREIDEPFSRNEIYSAFKEVSKDDYDEKERNEILRNLTKNGNNKSTFNNK